MPEKQVDKNPFMTALKETVVHSTFYNQQRIEVIDTDDYRTLYFGDRTLQSRQYFANPYYLALSYTQFMMSSLLLLKSPPQRVLLIGVGGGSIVHFLTHHYPECHIDGVDNNPYILEIAKTYFGLNQSDNISIHCENGSEFLHHQVGEPYDLILVDAYSEHGMSSAVFNQLFFSKCRNQLADDGVLTCNLWSGKEKQLKEVQSGLQTSFHSTMFIPVTGRGNIVSHSILKDIPWQDLRKPGNSLELWRERIGVDMVHIIEVALKHNLNWRRRVKQFLLGS